MSQPTVKKYPTEFKPTVSLDVISLVASSCGYSRSQIEPHAAQWLLLDSRGVALTMPCDPIIVTLSSFKYLFFNLLWVIFSEAYFA
jgi:hypothetical protein